MSPEDPAGLAGLAAELEALALDVAREAAALVRQRRAAGVEVAATKTSAIDVVTEADRASEELIRDRLLTRRPHDAVLGEEGDDVAGTSGVRWVVDPIDGTVNFLYGLPQYAVSIAAEVDGEAVAGVVLDVAKDRAYVAGPAGARCDDVRVGSSERASRALRVRTSGGLGELLVATGFSYDADLKAQQGAAVAQLLPRIRDVRRMGSCALDLCAVAEGTVDAYLEEGVNPWDHAAGALLARLAGARVELGTGVGGRTLLLAATPEAFGPLREATVEAGFWAG